MITLPFAFDPPFALFALLTLLVAAWIYTRPHEHFIKQLMWYMMISRTESYAWLLRRRARPNYHRIPAIGAAFFWLVTTSMTGVILFSVMILLGIFRSPPPTNPPGFGKFDPTKFEIVTHG